MKRCVIVGGAEIRRYDRATACFEDEDFFVYCDSGLRHLPFLKKQPDLIIGDFDSHPKPETKTETIVLPCVKDDTDTVFAAKEGIKRGFDSFLLIGCIGGRLDHSMANISILLMLHGAGKKAKLIDDYSEMEIAASDPVMIPDSFSFFSLLNVSGVSAGITIKNAKYPLENACISSDYQYGVSNEVTPGTCAEVSVKSGNALLIKIFSDV